MRFTLRKGLDLPITGKPQQSIQAAKAVRTLAVFGPDYLGLKPSIKVEEGESVVLGQLLFEDKSNPALRVVAPASGIVKTIHRGARRVLQAVVIERAAVGETAFKSHPAEKLPQLESAPVRAQLIEAGLWSAFRTRPYSKVPLGDAEARAIFVTAVDSNPLAADPVAVIREYQGDFRHGLILLTRLTKGKVYVCTAEAAAVSVPVGGQVVSAEFAGPHPAGLAGTHIHHIEPASAKRVVWHIGYQDVIAIGKLFTTGKLWNERVISLAGPMVKNPRLLRVPLGASTEEIIEGELVSEADCRVISGSVFNGRRAANWAAYLGRYHTQVTVLEEGHGRHLFGWVNPAVDRHSVSNVFFSALNRARQFAFNTSTNGSPRAMVPIGNYERVMPLDILPTQLLRALLVRDTDTAQALGALELDEEDLALCSYVCVGKYDYAPHLRACLDQIEREG